MAQEIKVDKMFIIKNLSVSGEGKIKKIFKSKTQK